MTSSARARVAVILLVLVATPVAAAAQNARVGGRVRDVNGQPVADATITLHNVDTGQVVETKTNDDGRYFRRALPIGRYEITVAKEGFIPSMDQRRLGTGQTDHDVVLEPMMVAAPGDPSSSPEYVAAYDAFNAGDQARVIDILTPMVEREPDFAPARLLLARAHFELNHWEEAVAGYSRLIELQPDIPIAYLDRGVAFVETGDMERAAADFETALGMQPDDADVHYNIGAIYVRADRVDDAIRFLTSATELNPEHALAHKALAFALVRRDDMAGAIMHLERYLEIQPDAPDAAEMTALLEQLRGS